MVNSRLKATPTAESGLDLDTQSDEAKVKIEDTANGTHKMKWNHLNDILSATRKCID